MAEGFVFYRSFYEAIKALPGEQAKAVLIAVSEYALDGILPDGADPVALMAFTLIKPQIDANQKRRESGKIGAVKRWQSDGKPIANDSKPMASHSKPKQTVAKDKVKDKDKDKDKVKVKDKDKEKVKDKEKIYVDGAESEKDPAPGEPPIITIPLNDGTEYPVTKEQFDEWLTLYPAVDVLAELRKMRGWCLENRAKRKTKNGVGRFIVSWLSREQDKPHKEFSGYQRQNQNQNENVFLSMLEGRTDDQGRNTEDSCDTESGISDVLPWA